MVWSVGLGGVLSVDIRLLGCVVAPSGWFVMWVIPGVTAVSVETNLVGKVVDS